MTRLVSHPKKVTERPRAWSIYNGGRDKIHYLQRKGIATS